MIQFLKLHHGSFIVRDTQAALAFYQGVLGLELDNSRPVMSFPGAWLNLGEGQIHLLELPNPDPVKGRPQHVGRDRHLACSVLGLDEIAERLDAAEIAYTRSQSGRKAIFFRDPDGNGIELVEQA